MRELLLSMRVVIGHGCWHVGDLVWRLFLQSIRHDLRDVLRLWEDGEGNLLGFAIYTPSKRDGYLELQVHPRAQGRGLEEEMLGWVEGVYGATAGPVSHLYTDAGVYADDRSQIAALERRGFRRGQEDSLLLLRSLQETVPEPTLPEGYTVHCVADESEAPNRAAAHREAFHPSRVTDEGYLRLMRTPGYDRNLDLVAVAPDGAFASFCLGWLDEVNKVGEFEPVGTRPAFRRKGLARAVLMEGMRRMKACGMENALVGPIYADDPAAVRLYQSAGFHEINRTHSYSREA